MDGEERRNVEIALDDFIGFSMSVEGKNIERDLELAIEEMEERLYWYKILLNGIRKKNLR